MNLVETKIRMLYKTLIALQCCYSLIVIRSAAGLWIVPHKICLEIFSKRIVPACIWNIQNIK